MGLFRWSKDKCFPYGEEKVNGEIPASFPEHDLRPVREDHISRLGVHFDWVKECSRCGIEYLGGDPSLEGEEYETEKRRRIDQVDELVKTLPYFTGNLTLVAKRKDLGSNCCPKKNMSQNGWHSLPSSYEKSLSRKSIGFWSIPKFTSSESERDGTQDWRMIFVSNSSKRPMSRDGRAIVRYDPSELTDSSHYENNSFKLIWTSSLFRGIEFTPDFISVYSCKFCGELVKAAGRNPSNDTGGE